MEKVRDSFILQANIVQMLRFIWSALEKHFLYYILVLHTRSYVSILE